MTGTFYDWLGIAPDASTDEILNALRNKVLELTELKKRLRNHPDPRTEKLVSLAFQKIAQARDTLLYPQKRLAYDRSSLIQPNPGSSITELTPHPSIPVRASPGSTVVRNQETSQRTPQPVRSPGESSDFPAYSSAVNVQSAKPALPKVDPPHSPEWVFGTDVPLPLELLDGHKASVPEPLPPQPESEELPDWLKSYTPPEDKPPDVPAGPRAASPPLGEQDLPYWLVDQGTSFSPITPQSEEPVEPDRSPSEPEEPLSWTAGIEPSSIIPDGWEDYSSKNPSTHPLEDNEISPLGELKSEGIPDWLAGFPVPETRQTQPFPPEPPVSSPPFEDFSSPPLETPSFSMPAPEPVILSSGGSAHSPEEPPHAQDAPAPLSQETSEINRWVAALPPMEIGESPEWLDQLDAFLATSEPVPLEPFPDYEPPTSEPAVHPEPPPLRDVPIPGPSLPPAVTTEALPVSKLGPKTTGREIRRYGRVEYYTPLDKGWAYPLRIGLYLDQHGKKALQAAHIRWTTLQLATNNDEEPTLRIIPSSKYLRFFPASQELRVIKGEDAFADFRLVPQKVPNTFQNKCELRIDFLFRNKVIQTVSLELRVQWKLRLGPLQISHMQWKWLGFLGIFDAAAGLFGFLSPSGSLSNLLLLSLSLLSGLFILFISFLLWRHSARRLHQIF